MNNKDIEIEILEQRVESLRYRLSQITPQNAEYSRIKKECEAILRRLAFIKGEKMIELHNTKLKKSYRLIYPKGNKAESPYVMSAQFGLDSLFLRIKTPTDSSNTSMIVCIGEKEKGSKIPKPNKSRYEPIQLSFKSPENAIELGNWLIESAEIVKAKRDKEETNGE